MFLEEAIWIRKVLESQFLKPGQTVLDVGSSTEEFRCLRRPYIDYYIFRPLRKLGIQIIHMDKQKEEGVDIICDLSTASDITSAVHVKSVDVVLCTNLLEHVEDRGAVVEKLKKLVKPEGVLVLTVPNFYKYHPDPIDTMFRPTSDELVSLFEGKDFEKVTSETIEIMAEPVIQKARLYWIYRGINFISRILGLKFRLEHVTIIRNKVAAAVLKKTSVITSLKIDGK